MTTAAWWRETRGRFVDLATNDEGRKLSVSGTDLLTGGSSMTKHQFRLIATGAARAATGQKDAGLETWVELLGRKLRPHEPGYFHIYSGSSFLKPRTIRLSRIDPPKKGRRRGKRGTEGTDPTALIEAAERAQKYMEVTPGKGSRFAVISPHREIYAARKLSMTLRHQGSSN